MSVALVTGGGNGIGRAIALRLAHEGTDISVVDVDDSGSQKTAELVQKTGKRAICINADVSDVSQVEKCVEATERQLGPITKLANNAGIEGVIAPIHQYPVDVLDRLLNVNVRGSFLVLKCVLARMMARSVGSVVNMASTSAIRGRAGLAGYVATKHAVLGLTRVAALDVARTRVRVNAVLPGPVETRMIRTLDRQAQQTAQPVKRAGAVRYGKPEEIANVVAFLLSDAAGHVNGAAWTVDAGSTVP